MTPTIKALRSIAETLEDHPAYMGEGLTAEDFVREGGDAATVTELAYEARAALAAAEAQPEPAAAEPARTSPVHMPVHGWTDADADASRLALELECLLTDKDMPMPVVSRWWQSAHEALDLHRQRLDAAPRPAKAPQPLTDEQIEQCISDWSTQGWGYRRGELTLIARAIERAHGISQGDE